VSEKYEFIAAEYAQNEADGVADAPTLTQMLSWLDVSKSGYYEWRERRPSASERRRELLKIKIKVLFENSGATYGYRRIHAELVRAGERVGEELVRKLMRELGLVPVQPRPYRTTTVRGPQQPDSPDLVRRDFTAERPGTKLVGDITCIGGIHLTGLIRPRPGRHCPRSAEELQSWFATDADHLAYLRWSDGFICSGEDDAIHTAWDGVSAHHGPPVRERLDLGEPIDLGWSGQMNTPNTLDARPGVASGD
jgi:hypothetical protein